MKINRNYLAGVDTETIVPYVFRDAVPNLAALQSIVSPLDGEIRWVVSESKNYQYNKTTNSWNEIVIGSSGSGSGDMYKSVYDVNNNGIVDKAEVVDDGNGNVSTASEIRKTVDSRPIYIEELKVFEIQT